MKWIKLAGAAIPWGVLVIMVMNYPILCERGRDEFPDRL